MRDMIVIHKAQVEKSIYDTLVTHKAQVEKYATGKTISRQPPNLSKSKTSTTKQK